MDIQKSALFKDILKYILGYPKIMLNIGYPKMYFVISITGPAGSVVEHPLRDREVVGSNPGRAIPKALKMVPVATLLGAQHYKASTGFSSPNKNIAQLTSQHLQK